MNVRDLNEDQIRQLKESILLERMETDEEPSWGELADVNTLVSDEEVYDKYADIYFVPEDFCY